MLWHSSIALKFEILTFAARFLLIKTEERTHHEGTYSCMFHADTFDVFCTCRWMRQPRKRHRNAMRSGSSLGRNPKLMRQYQRINHDGNIFKRVQFAPVSHSQHARCKQCDMCRKILGAGSGNRTRTLSLEGSYDTISPYPLRIWVV